MKAAIFAAIVLAIAPAIAQAQVYKWVDEKGVTHYGERPAGKNARPVPLKDAAGGPREEQAEEPKPRRSPRPAGETALQRQEREFQQRHESRTREEDSARDAQARRASPDLGECRRATSDLATIRRNTTNYTYADEARARDAVSRHCR